MAQVTDTLGTWGAAGVQRVPQQILDLPALEPIALIARDVVPAVRDR